MKPINCILALQSTDCLNVAICYFNIVANKIISRLLQNVVSREDYRLKIDQLACMNRSCFRTQLEETNRTFTIDTANTWTDLTMILKPQNSHKHKWEVMPEWNYN